MNKMKIPRLFKTPVSTQNIFIVAAESLEGRVASATLTSIPADSVHTAVNRLELRLEGRSESFVVEGASYRLEKGDRVVVYTEPVKFINPEQLELLCHGKTPEKDKNYMESIFRKTKLKIDKDKFYDLSVIEPIPENSFNNYDAILKKYGVSEKGLSLSELAALNTYNRHITTRVVGLQVLDKKGGVKFQAVHERGYAFTYKP